jgi:hypothetical protein
MEHRALAALIIRITGMLIIFWAISDAGKAFGPIFYQDSIQKIGIGLLLLSIVFSFVVPLAAGLLLVYFPGLVTTRILRIPGIEGLRESDLPNYERVAFAAIGLWWTLDAVLDGLYVYAKSRIYLRIIEDYPVHTRPPAVTPDDFASYVVSGLQLAIGLWLLLGNRGLAGVLHRIRS